MATKTKPRKAKAKATKKRAKRAKRVPEAVVFEPDEQNDENTFTGLAAAAMALETEPDYTWT